MDSILIIGPTAVGKSDLAIRLAMKLDGEIVSIDSRQIYTGLDIGTSKPSEEERLKVPHHLIDIIGLEQKPNAWWFATEAREAIAGIIGRKKIPILVGGSGMYLRAVVDGFFKIDLDPLDRKDFASKIQGMETVELFSRLKVVDEESTRRIHHNDRYRIIRSLEVYELTGTTISEHFRCQRQSSKGTLSLDILKTGLKMERQKLRDKIGNRTLQMFNSGWIKEVDRLLESGAKASWPGMKTLGYPEVISHLGGFTGKDEMINRIITQTRQYAKKQMTWFRKESDVNWIDMDQYEPFDIILKALDSEG